MSEKKKVPDAAEIASIKETHQLYRSNLFRRQVEEVLSESKPKKKRIGEIVKNIPKIFEDFPRREVTTPFNYDGFKFYNQASSDLKGFFMTKPSFQFVGSYELNTITKWRQVVDLAIELPKDIFQSKDYLNYRYGDKRQAYLAQIKNWFSKSRWADGTVHLEYENGDVYKPIIVLKPEDTPNWTIHIRTIIPEDLFLAEKLGTDRNCLRDESNPESDRISTPCYNASVLEDIFTKRCLIFQSNSLNKWTHLADAIILLKRWALNQ